MMRSIAVFMLTTSSVLLGAVGSIYETAVPPPQGAKYRSADYRIWLPKDAEIVRAIIVHQHGCGRNGITVPFDVHWQALAAKWNCALMGTYYTVTDGCRDWWEPDNGSAEAFLAGRDGLLPWSYGLEITKLVMAAYMSAERQRTVDLTDPAVQEELETFVPLIQQGRGAEVLYVA